MENQLQYESLKKKSQEDFFNQKDYSLMQSTFYDSKMKSKQSKKKEEQQNVDFSDIFNQNFQAFQQKEKIQSFAQNIEIKRNVTTIDQNIFNKLDTIAYPHQVQEFLEKNPDFYFEHIQELQNVIFFSENRLCFYHYDFFEEKKSYYNILEENEHIYHVNFCGFEQDKQIYLIYLQNQIGKFYFQSNAKEFIHLDIQLNKQIKQIFYSQNLNQTFLVDINDNIYILKINLRNQNFNLKKIDLYAKNESFGSIILKSTRQQIAKISSFMQDGFNKRFKDYTFKEFGDLLIILEKKFIIKNKLSQLRSQQFYIFQIQQDKDIVFNDSINFASIIGYNINLIDYMNFKNKIFEYNSLIQDFIIKDQNYFLVLLQSGTEILFNYKNKTIKKIIPIILFDSHDQLFYFQNYYNENLILVNQEQNQFLIDKSKLCAFLFMNPYYLENYSLVSLKEFGQYSLIKLKNKFLFKNHSEIFLKFDIQKGIEVYEKYQDLDYLINILYIDHSLETINQHLLYQDFLHEFFEFKNNMKDYGFQQLLLNILLKYDNLSKKKIPEFIEDVIQKYNIKKNFLQNEFLSVSNLLKIILKYISLFNFEINIQNNKSRIKFANQKEEQILQVVDYLFLKKIFLINQKVGQECVYLSKQNKIYPNLNLVLSLENYQISVNQMRKAIFYLNQKDIQTNEIQVSLVNSIKIIQQIFQEGQKFEYKKQFGDLINSSTKKMIERLDQILSFCQYIVQLQNQIPSDILKYIADINIQSLLFLNENNKRIQTFLFLTGNFSQDDNAILNKFFNNHQKEALKLLQNYLNKPNLFQTKDYSVKDTLEHFKQLNFDVLQYFLETFWKNGDFLVFIKVLINRISFLLDQQALNDNKNELEQIQIFLISVLFKLKNQQKNKKTLMDYLKYFQQRIKKKFFFNVDQNEEQKFVLEQKLLALKLQTKKKILKNITEVILNSSIQQLRENCLIILFESSDNDLVQEIEYQNKLEDILNIKNNKNLFQGKIGRQNLIYLVKYLEQKKEYKNCIKIIIQLFQNQDKENFFLQFQQNIEILALLDEKEQQNVQSHINQFKNFSLEYLKNFIKAAFRMSKFLKQSQQEDKLILDTLLSLELTLNINYQILLELKEKKNLLERLLILAQMKPQVKIINQFIQFLNIQIELINLNPLIQKGSFSYKVIQVNKLHMAILLKYQQNLSFDYKEYQKKIENAIIYFGKFNSIKNIGKISNYFNLRDNYKEKTFFHLYSNPAPNDISSLKELENLDLIYPFNVPNKFHQILARFFMDSQFNISAWKSVITKIETMNISNNYFKNIIVDFVYDQNDKDSRILWHLYFLFNLFQKNHDQQNLNLIFTFLECYIQLIDQQDQTGSLIQENLRNKYIHSFILIYQLLIQKVRFLCEKKQKNNGIVQFLIEFRKKNQILIKQLESIKKIKPSTFANYELSNYFKQKEKVNQLIQYGTLTGNLKYLWDIEQFNQIQNIKFSVLKSI